MTLTLQDPAADFIQTLVERGMNLPALPSVGAELMRAISRPIDEIDLPRLAGLLENDPALSARMLRLANSPFFGAKSEVGSLNQALMMLGLDEALEFLNYYLVRKAMPVFPTTPHFDNERFWRHSWAAGNIARMLGNPAYLVSALPGELYLGGLMHGLGKALMALHMPDEFERALAMHAAEGVPLAEAERMCVGIDHATLAARLLEQWNLPAAVVAGVRGHLEPASAEDGAAHENGALIEYAVLLAGEWCDKKKDEAGVECLAESWICTSGSGPLVDRDTQISLLTAARSQLRHKAIMLFGNDAGDEEEAAPAERPGPARRPTPAKAAPVGFWGRFRHSLGF